MKIEKALGLDEGSLLMLQCYYDIEKEQKKLAQMRKPDLSLIRQTIFWDTDINGINWERQSRPVIKRIFDRGNMAEKREITRFYGMPKLRSAIKRSTARLRKLNLTS